MQMRRLIFWIVLVVLVVLVVLAIVFWPTLRAALPHPALVEAWADYLVEDLKIGQWGPVVALLLVGLLELIWALILGRRSGAHERQLARLERVHAREVTNLIREITQLQEQHESVLGELELFDDLIREEKVRLWAQFDQLQRASGLSLTNLAMPGSPGLPAELRGEWRRVISQLERIEMVTSVTVRAGDEENRTHQRAEELLRLGGACYHLGQFERALTHYSRAIDLVPDELDALISHAVVNQALGRSQPALQDLEHVLKYGENPWAYFHRGVIREQIGQNRRALEDYTRALRLDRGFVEAHYRRGLLYARAGEHDKAFQDQSEVLEMDPNHAAAYTARGMARAALNDTEWALNDLDRGCALAPQHPQAFLERGRLRHQLGMHEQALADFGRVIELSSDFPAVYMARGGTYMALGQYWQAISDYGQVLKLQPTSAEAYFARGKARSAMKEYRRAIDDYDQALEINPGQAIVLTERGAAYEKLGDHEKAVRDLDQAIALDPNLAVAYQLRGLVYGSLGEYDVASRDLNKAAELDPSLKADHEGPPGLARE